jgi:predicted DNA-binding protein (UPF0251 family)
MAKRRARKLPTKNGGPGTTKAVSAARVEEAVEMILRGLPRRELVDRLAERWDVSRATVDRYVKRARASLAEERLVDRRAIVTEALERLRHVYYLSIGGAPTDPATGGPLLGASGKPKTGRVDVHGARAAVVEMVKIAGAMPPAKTAATTPDGERPAFGAEDVARVVAELTNHGDAIDAEMRRVEADQQKETDR